MDELNNGSNTEQWQTNSVGPETNGSDGFGRPQIGPYAALAGKTREVLSSNLVLAMIISLAVSILCSISASIIGSKTALFQVVDYFEQMGMDEEVINEMYDYINATSDGPAAMVGSVFGAIIGTAPIIVAAIGYLIIWLSAKNSESNSMSTSGFTVLKVMNIIGLVGYILCIVLMFLAVVLVALFSTQVFGGYGALIAGVMIVASVFGAGIILLYVFKNVGLNSTIDYLTAAANGFPSVKKISGFAMGMIFVTGAFGALGALTSIASGNIFNILSAAGSAAYYILLGVSISRLRNISYQFSGNGV